MQGLNTSVPPRTGQQSAQNSSAEAWDVACREVGQRPTAHFLPSGTTFAHAHLVLLDSNMSSNRERPSVGLTQVTIEYTRAIREFTERMIIVIVSCSISCKSCSSKAHWHRRQRILRPFSPEDHEVRRWYPQGYGRLRRVVR